MSWNNRLKKPIKKKHPTLGIPFTYPAHNSLENKRKQKVFIKKHESYSELWSKSELKAL